MPLPQLGNLDLEISLLELVAVQKPGMSVKATSNKTPTSNQHITSTTIANDISSNVVTVGSLG